MKLFEMLKKARIIAMKEHQTVKKDLLGTVIAECSKKDKEPENDIVISTIKKFIENNKLVLEHDPTNAKISLENDILNSYLPKQLTETYIRFVIKDLVVNGYGIKEINQHFKTNFPGQYDGKVLNQIIKE